MDSIRYYKHFLQSGLMAMEPQTGNIKAWVGGIDYKYFQYDHVGAGTSGLYI
jgi:penicillin-binding protein 1A